MDLLSPADAPAAPALRERAAIDDRYKWNLSSIFPDWQAWDMAYAELDAHIGDSRDCRVRCRVAVRRCSRRCA
ncbi:MAG: hypothetical protein QM736_25060 [Vicinamibacterales bacterium]